MNLAVVAVCGLLALAAAAWHLRVGVRRGIRREWL
jgi:hypothetical protein